MSAEYREIRRAGQLPLEGFEERPSKVDVLRAVLISLGGYNREALDVIECAIPDAGPLVGKIRNMFIKRNDSGPASVEISVGEQARMTEDN